jgi:hypothetical protein
VIRCQEVSRPHEPKFCVVFCGERERGPAARRRSLADKRGISLTWNALDGFFIRWSARPDAFSVHPATSPHTLLVEKMCCSDAYACSALPATLWFRVPPVSATTDVK